MSVVISVGFKLSPFSALSRNQVKLSFLLAINCLIPDIIANVVA